MRGPEMSSLRAVWAPSLVRRVCRNRWFRAAVLATVGLMCAIGLSTRAAALDDARASWGELSRVAVVVQPIAPGSLVEPSIEFRDVPRAFVPDGVVVAVDSTSRAKVDLHPGELLLEARVTASAASVLPPGTAALTLQVVADVPLIKEGDLVDLWSVDSANLSSRRVGRTVVVLALSDRHVTVAVPEDQVEAATVASLRPVTVTLVG